MIDSLPDDVRARLHDESVPTWRSPTLATLTDKRFSDPGLIFERKLDGVRGLAFRDGDWEVCTTGPQGSGILSSMVAGNCLVILDEARGDVAAGERVTVEPFEAV